MSSVETRPLSRPNTSKQNTNQNETRDEFNKFDVCARDIGRLVIKTILQKPEVPLNESLNRFFFDSWLSKNNSNLSLAEKFSIELLTELQRSISDVTSKISLDENENEWLAIKNGNIYLREALISKTLCSLGMEAYDNILKEFNGKIPVLQEIRRAILPSIFSEFPFTDDLEENELSNIERIFTDDVPRSTILSNDIDLIQNHRKTNIALPVIEHTNLENIEESNNNNPNNNDNQLQHQHTKGLSGNKYNRFKTWHECFCEIKERLKQQDIQVRDFFIEKDNLYQKIETLNLTINNQNITYDTLLNEKKQSDYQYFELRKLYNERIKEFEEITKSLQLEFINSQSFKRMYRSQSFQLVELQTQRDLVQEKLNAMIHNQLPDIRLDFRIISEENNNLKLIINNINNELLAANNIIEKYNNRSNESKEMLIIKVALLNRNFQNIERFVNNDENIIKLTANATAPLNSDNHSDNLIDYMDQWLNLLTKSYLSYQLLIKDLKNTIKTERELLFNRDIEYKNDLNQLRSQHRDEIKNIEENHSFEIMGKNDIILQLQLQIDSLKEEKVQLNNEIDEINENFNENLEIEIKEWKNEMNYVTDRMIVAENRVNMFECDNFYIQSNNKLKILNNTLNNEIIICNNNYNEISKLCDLLISDINSMNRRILLLIGSIPTRTARFQTQNTSNHPSRQATPRTLHTTTTTTPRTSRIDNASNNHDIKYQQLLIHKDIEHDKYIIQINQLSDLIPILLNKVNKQSNIINELTLQNEIKSEMNENNCMKNEFNYTTIHKNYQNLIINYENLKLQNELLINNNNFYRIKIENNEMLLNDFNNCEKIEIPLLIDTSIEYENENETMKNTARSFRPVSNKFATSTPNYRPFSTKMSIHSIHNNTDNGFNNDNNNDEMNEIQSFEELSFQHQLQLQLQQQSTSDQNDFRSIIMFDQKFRTTDSNHNSAANSIDSPGQLNATTELEYMRRKFFSLQDLYCQLIETIDFNANNNTNIFQSFNNNSNNNNNNQQIIELNDNNNELKEMRIINEKIKEEIENQKLKDLLFSFRREINYLNKTDENPNNNNETIENINNTDEHNPSLLLLKDTMNTNLINNVRNSMINQSITIDSITLQQTQTIFEQAIEQISDEFIQTSKTPIVLIEFIRKHEKLYAKELGIYSIIIRETKNLLKYLIEKLNEIKIHNDFHNDNDMQVEVDEDVEVGKLEKSHKTNFINNEINNLTNEIMNRMDWIFDVEKLTDKIVSYIVNN